MEWESRPEPSEIRHRAARPPPAPRPVLRPTRHARRASHHHAPQTGALNSSAQTAIATGPSSPANTDAATVSVPKGIPSHQAARRYPKRQSLRQPRARGSPHGASTIKDDDAIIAAITHVPVSEVPPASGRNRAAACTTTPAGSQSNASGQNPRRFFGASLSMPTGCTLRGGSSRGGVDTSATGGIGTLRNGPVPERACAGTRWTRREPTSQRSACFARRSRRRARHHAARALRQLGPFPGGGYRSCVRCGMDQAWLQKAAEDERPRLHAAKVDVIPAIGPVRRGCGAVMDQGSARGGS